MTISCSTRWAENVGIERTLAAIHAAGFTRADLLLSDAAAGQAWVEAVRPDWLHAGGLHLLDAVTPQQIREGIRIAGRLNLHVLTLGAGPRRQESMQYFVQTLELALADAPTGFQIELVNRSGSRIEQLGDFHELFVLAGRAQLTVAIDAIEFHRASVNPCDAIGELGDRMSRLIVGDMIGDRRVPLGEGEINIRAVIERARRIGYNGSIVLDPCVSDPNAPLVDLTGEHDRLRAMLDG